MLVDVSRRREYAGLTQRFATLPKGELILNRFDPGATLPQHNHEHVQFGFSVIGQFDLFVGERMARHTIGSERAYTLGSNVLHGAAQKTDEPVLSIDLKLLISEESVPLPELSFHEPLVERFEWGSCLSYDHPWWKCRYVCLNPYRRVEVDAGNGDQHIVVVERDHREFGRVYETSSPTTLESQDNELLAVCVELRPDESADATDSTVDLPLRGRSSAKTGRQTNRAAEEQPKKEIR